MKTFLFYALGTIWLLLGAASLNCLGAADYVIIPLPCYIMSAILGAVSFAALFAAQAIAIAEGWLDFEDEDQIG